MAVGWGGRLRDKVRVRERDTRAAVYERVGIEEA